MSESAKTILDLAKDELELDDPVAGFINAALWEGSFSSLELGWPRRWRGPRSHYSRRGQMKLPRVREA